MTFPIRSVFPTKESYFQLKNRISNLIIVFPSELLPESYFSILNFILRRRLSDGVVHEPQSRHTDPGPRVPLPGDGHTLGDGQMTSNETAQVPDWTVSQFLDLGQVLNLFSDRFKKLLINSPGRGRSSRIGSRCSIDSRASTSVKRNFVESDETV